MHPDTKNRNGAWRRTMAVLGVTAMASALLVVASQPSGATITKSVGATCLGADKPSIGLINGALGGPISAPLTAITDAPKFLEPGQKAVPVSVTWQLSLSPDLVTKATGLGLKSMTISNTVADTKVTGPVKETTIKGRPANQTVNLTPGKPFSSSFGPFKGTLEDIGNSGVIKLSVGAITFSISMSLAGKPVSLNLTCAINATIASIPIKVAGSPNIQQPIEVPGVAGTDVTVDVLGKYVTNGTTKDGVVKPVDPRTLKVVEGPGTVVDGKLVIPSPAAGASADTTFEVCAGQVETLAADPGSSETQQIVLSFDGPNSLLRKPLAYTFKIGTEVTDIVWTAKWPTDQWITDPKPKDWKKVAGNYFPAHTVFPPAETIQKALEGLPSVGAGNVKVTETFRGAGKGDLTDEQWKEMKPDRTRVVYKVEFINAMANKDVPTIALDHLYSILPIEDYNALFTALTDALTKQPPPDPNAPPDPDKGKTPDELFKEADHLWSTGKFQESLDKRVKAILAWVDVPENQASVLKFIRGIWPPDPTITTPIPGTNPVAAQIQDLCSQGIVTVTSAAVSPETTTVPGAPGATVQEATLVPTG